ncbi:hypothetical protein CMV30_06835 [Nibricoccus aquaticus]|uniref:Reelin domain-containing protein n=1 Tax=Nibricoccus aquaticus TaxID=2576891 RepID=A0A290Q921_9BACT|nr:hypothetical protein [Nibricoccus aquaticus]ATC63690.1 hypothetical protein CMV30_06835 [Nibricoccus aquaticus]
MRALLLLLLVVFACGGCQEDFQAFDCEVEILGSLPPTESTQEANAVLFRVLIPAKASGKYGVAFTTLSRDAVEKKKGMIFKIRRLGKWRHLLTDSPPTRASVSNGEDFFSTAVQK